VLKIIYIYERRCDERPKTKAEEFARLAYTLRLACTVEKLFFFGEKVKEVGSEDRNNYRYTKG
jgi:hypothetical protein